MDKDGLKISIIIPTYNRVHLVTDSIDSVLNQTYKNFELFVVDDHSTDNTEKAVKSYADPRVKYLLNDHKKGAQGARNTGLKTANGEWVALLDSDDVWIPEKLEKQVDYLLGCKENIVGLSTATASYDFKNKKILKNNIPSKKVYSTEELLYKNYLGSGFSSFLFNREKALVMGGFDEDFPAMQDMDFYVSLSLEGEIHVLNKVLVYIRTVNEDRISTDYRKKLLAAKKLNQKYKSLVDRDRLQAANRHGRIIYYSILSNQPYAIDFQNLFLLLVKDFRHFIAIVKVFIKHLW